jgi:hypothetical protein
MSRSAPTRRVGEGRELRSPWSLRVPVLERASDEGRKPDERLLAPEPPSLLKRSHAQLLELLRAPLLGGRLAQR